MELSEYVLFAMTLMVVSKEGWCALECAQCMSDGSGDCAISPPPATTCNSELHKGPVNCMVAKRKNATGSLVQFIRGCTSVWISSGCIDQTDDTTLCYDICSSDNCNSSNRGKVELITVLIALLVIQIL